VFSSSGRKALNIYGYKLVEYEMGHEVQVGEIRNAHRNLIWKSKGRYRSARLGVFRRAIE
jgi:hypothetical protein